MLVPHCSSCRQLVEDLPCQAWPERTMSTLTASDLGSSQPCLPVDHAFPQLVTSNAYACGYNANVSLWGVVIVTVSYNVTYIENYCTCSLQYTYGMYTRYVVTDRAL